MKDYSGCEVRWGSTVAVDGLGDELNDVLAVIERVAEVEALYLSDGSYVIDFLDDVETEMETISRELGVPVKREDTIVELVARYRRK